MKKVLFFILLACTFMACNTTVYELQMETIDVYIGAEDWKYTNYDQNGSPYANNYFFATVNVPEITQSVFEKGQVNAFVVYDANTSYASKHILPYVRHYEEQLSNGDWNFYTETVDCMYGPGWVEFNYRASDFAYENDVTINPVGMRFSIVITHGY
mgnify:CR=1 FL=1